MGSKQVKRFSVFSWNIFRMKMFVFFFFSLFQLDLKTGMGKCQDIGNNDLSQLTERVTMQGGVKGGGGKMRGV